MTSTTAIVVTSADILHHTAAFLSESISQSELRHKIISTLRSKIPPSDQRPLNFAAETLERAISSTNITIRSSSLRLSKNLLLSYSDTPLSSFLLSLIHSLLDQPLDAAITLLGIFSLDPSLARSELSSSLFETLFLPHFLPVHKRLNKQRSTILSSQGVINNEPDEEDYSISDASVTFPPTKLLSKVSGDQATELKELERTYEKVIDENCRVFANYFREILKNKLINQPSLVYEESESKSSEQDGIEETKKNKTEEHEIQNKRYNPIWNGEERSVDFPSTGSESSEAKPPSFVPQRVSPDILKNQIPPALTTPTRLDSDHDLVGSSSDEDSADYSTSSESEPETEEKNRNSDSALFSARENTTQEQEQPVLIEEIQSSDYLMASSRKHTSPKDFVCPITSQLFDDPVTLETGQTYERRAIQEWLDRGNSTCPITRQELQSTQLPKTNYVLKRLIASWQEQNHGSATLSRSSDQHVEPEPELELMIKPEIVPVSATSPNSVISQAAIDRTLSELRDAIDKLCLSEILKESEMAVIQIERYWQEIAMDLEAQTMLSKPPVIHGFVEILFNSVDPQVLKSTVFLLSELGSRDRSVIQTLTQVDSDVDCIVALFKKGLFEAVVLIYLLQPSISRLVQLDMVETLLTVLELKDDELIKMCLNPKTASVLLLWRIVRSNEESVVTSIVSQIISSEMIETIVGSLEAELAEERTAAVGILKKCMQKEGKCRNTIADIAKLRPVLEGFINASEGDRFLIVQFFYELVKLNRRTSNEQILQIIKHEGAFSTMHCLLLHLQTALPDQCPAVAGLLLQLDLLAEPRKMSIYREEAIDAFVSCLRNSESPASQMAAAETIVALQGRFTATGKPLTRPFLLKQVGLERSYRHLMRKEKLNNISGELKDISGEENAADAWERKMAFVLASHEFGLLFEALAEGLKSRNTELSTACFVAATWLIHMLGVLPDTGIRGAARVCLLKPFISIFKSAKDIEDKSLSLLALRSFMQDPEGLRDLSSSMKDIVKGLRELKRSSPIAVEVLKVLSEEQESSADLWNHKELLQVDSSENGEVLSIACSKDKIFSGHSDGTIKVWTRSGSNLHLIQETKEHTKAVTSLSILQTGEGLYSGSLDKTARVWSIGNEEIDCIQVHEMKDQVHSLVVADKISCFIPQGASVKVYSWNGQSKVMNPNKNIKCLALVRGRLYCGCQDSSIQELDLATETVSSIQTGTRKLLGKAHPVLALQVHNELLYSANSSLEGTAIKTWNTSNYSMVSSVTTTSEVRTMAISSELIYLGCKGGIIEAWDQKKHNKIETLQTGTNCKVISMALDENEEVLMIGTSDGRIQAWELC